MSFIYIEYCQLDTEIAYTITIYVTIYCYIVSDGQYLNTNVF